MIRAVISIAFGVGCMPSSTPETVADGTFTNDTGALGAPSEKFVFLSTLSTDYSMGAIARVDMDTLTVEEDLAVTTGDTVVATTGNHVVVLNRLNTDTVRIYDPIEWTQPLVEFALPDLANPQDAVICDDRIWVSQHNSAAITAHRLNDGIVIDRVDLTRWIGEDGYAEASSLRLHEGEIYLSVQQIDQLNAWTADGGTIIRFPCEGGSAEVVTEAAPSPSFVDTNDPSIFAIKTGLYDALDGGILKVGASWDSLQSLVSEQEVGFDITAAAITSTHLVYTTTTEDWNYSLHCMDLSTGDVVTGLTTQNFLSDLGVDQAGRIWVSARSGWAAGQSDLGGLHVFSSDRCEPLLTDGRPIQLTLNPYNLAFL